MIFAIQSRIHVSLVLSNVGKTMTDRQAWDSLYHLFMVIGGMLDYCFTHMSQFCLQDSSFLICKTPGLDRLNPISSPGTSLRELPWLPASAVRRAGAGDTD